MGEIKAQIEETTSDYDREKLQERLAKLAGGVAVIKVGAATEVELKEKKHRIEDALSTTRAAVEEGLVAGGGTALLQALPALDELKLEGDEAIGVNILRRALEAPIRQIAENAGQEGSVIVAAVRELPIGHGYDALRGEYGDMFDKGIVDAAKVTRSALQHAASIAGMVLTTETLVTDLPEKKEPAAAAQATATTTTRSTPTDQPRSPGGSTCPGSLLPPRALAAWSDGSGGASAVAGSGRHAPRPSSPARAAITRGPHQPACAPSERRRSAPASSYDLGLTAGRARPHRSVRGVTLRTFPFDAVPARTWTSRRPRAVRLEAHHHLGGRARAAGPGAVARRRGPRAPTTWSWTWATIAREGIYSPVSAGTVARLDASRDAGRSRRGSRARSTRRNRNGAHRGLRHPASVPSAAPGALACGGARRAVIAPAGLGPRAITARTRRCSTRPVLPGAGGARLPAVARRRGVMLHCDCVPAAAGARCGRLRSVRQPGS